MQITCRNCNWSVFEEMDVCPNCGAKLPAPASVSSVAPGPDTEDVKKKRILQACALLRGYPKTYVAPDIPEKCILAARKYMGVPPSEEVYLVYDDTFWGSCKLGFAVASDGLYWKNASVVDDVLQKKVSKFTVTGTKYIPTVPNLRCHLSWEELQAMGYVIEGRSLLCFGEDAAVNIPALGVARMREQILAMLAALGIFPRI